LSVFSTCPFCKICPIRPLRPQVVARTLGPLGLSSLGVFAKRRLFFESAQSSNDAFSISRHCHVGPTRQFHPSPRTGRPQSRHHLWSILDHQNLTHNLATMSPPISPLPPSIPALTREINPLESASIAINAIAITTDLEPLPRPYKRAPPPRGIPHLSHPSPALLPFSSQASIGASTAARSMPL
jgi:hypothetical protein